MKNITIIGLCILFNDFLGTLMAYIGMLLIKLGTLFASIPTII